MQSIDILARNDMVDLYVHETPEMMERIKQIVDVSKIDEAAIDEIRKLHDRIDPKCCQIDEFLIKLADGVGLKDKALKMSEQPGYEYFGIKVAMGMRNADKAKQFYERALQSDNSHFVAICAEAFGDYSKAIEMYIKTGSPYEAMHAMRKSGRLGDAIKMFEDGGNIVEAINVAREVGDETRVEQLYEKAASVYRGYSKSYRNEKMKELNEAAGKKFSRVKYGLMKIIHG